MKRSKIWLTLRIHTGCCTGVTILLLHWLNSFYISKYSSIYRGMNERRRISDVWLSRFFSHEAKGVRRTYFKNKLCWEESIFPLQISTNSRIHSIWLWVPTNNFFPIYLIFPLSKVKSPSILWNIALNFPKCQTRRTQCSSLQSDLAPLKFHSGVDFARRT